MKRESGINRFIQGITPPVILWSAQRILDAVRLEETRKHNCKKIAWTGNYESWEVAKAASDGYDAPLILAKVREATLKVRGGQAAYERDSVLFLQPDYNWAVLAYLLHVAQTQDGALDIIDFGGALGSSYFQHLCFWRSLKSCHWRVVEQAHYAACGQAEIADGHLTFYNDIQSAREAGNPTVLFASGVMQCLEKPYEWLTECVELGLPHIILDRTAFMTAGADRLTVQHVPEFVYKASYPAWYLDHSRVCSILGTRYKLVAEFQRDFDKPYCFEDGKWGHRQGMIWTRS